MLVIGGFCLAAGGAYSGLATFWSVPPLFLGGTAAAGAFALINSHRQSHRIVGTGIDGMLLKLTGDYKAGMWMCVAMPIVSALSMVVLSKSVSRSPR